MSTVWPIGVPAGELARIDFLGHEISVREDVVPCFELVAVRAIRSEYGRAYAAREIEPAPTGGYVYRNRRPYPPPVTVALHSEHSHGTTVDVDYDSNPLRFDGYLESDFDRFGLEDGREWLEAWLEPPPGLPVLFRWGGGWTTDPKTAGILLGHNGERVRTGTVDAMHFELALTPAEVRSYPWAKAIEKEAEMNKELEDAATFVRVLREELEPGRDDATVAGAAKRVAKTVVRDEADRKPADG